MTFDTIFAQAVTYVPAGLALIALAWILFQSMGGHIHYDSEVDGLRQDKRDMLDINKSQAAALAQANSTIASQNEIIRDSLRNGRG